MTDRDIRAREPGTAADLVADATDLGVPRASSRMIKDWTEHGLLAAPAFRKNTRHGSDARLHTPEQRALFHTLLHVSMRSPRARLPHHALVRIVLYLWLTEDDVVPHEQARRAWRTWARAAGKSSATARSASARAVVAQVAHHEAPYHHRRKAQLVLEQAAKSRSADWGTVHSVLHAVCSPWPAPPGQSVERALGTPELPFGVREVIAHWILKQHTIQLLAAEHVAEPHLDRVRSSYRLDRAEYESVCSAMKSRPADAALFTAALDPEARITELLAGFVLFLGYSLGHGEAAHARAAHTAR